MRSVFLDTTTSDAWATFDKYDDNGREILTAQPSAVSGYDDTRPDLLNNVSGNYQYLRDSSGLIQVLSYGTSTTATDSSAGDVAGYLKDVSVQQGETASAILQSRTQYFEHSGGGGTVHPTATSTVYRNSDGTGGETTGYSYTWFSSSTQMQSVTVTKPTVS